MNAEKFFERYSIEEINKKTRISPISLRYIKNKEFDKIPRVKFMGFVRLIEREFNVDLSELVEEYNLATKHIKEEPQKIKKEEPKKNNNKIIIALSLIALIISGIALYQYTKPKPVTFDTNVTEDDIFNIDENLSKSAIPQPAQEPIEKEPKKEPKKEQPIKEEPTPKIKETPKINEEKNSNQKQITKQTTKQPIEPKKIETPKTNQTQKAIDDKLVIIPKKLVWISLRDLDTNKTYEVLTSQRHEYKGKNWYLLLGTGMVTIKYAGKTFSPNVDRVVKMRLVDGNITILERKK